MGLNTTVLVLNDALNDICGDKNFGEKLVFSIMEGWYEGKEKNVSAGHFVNAATVIETHHNRDIAIVGIGGNKGSVLGYMDNPKTYKDIVRELADRLGYRLVRKSVRK